MKRMDILCSSQAATAIRLSNMDELPSSSSSSSQSSSFINTSNNPLSSGRAIDRCNPIIRDPRRIAKSLPAASCSSSIDLPISPKPHQHNYQAFKYENLPSKSEVVVNEPNKKKKIKKGRETNVINSKLSNENWKSSVDSSNSSKNVEGGDIGVMTRKSRSCTRLSYNGDFISPPGSSRYLLSDQQSLFNGKSDFDPIPKLVQELETSKSRQVQNHESSCASKPFSSSSVSSDQVQVVVLRVSLHCRGCERKMRKHISRMEGVSSFNIDFAAKKVTVVGNVTPLDVLASISKVKNAQLWSPPPPAAARPSPVPVSNTKHSFIETKKI